MVSMSLNLHHTYIHTYIHNYTTLFATRRWWRCQGRDIFQARDYREEHLSEGLGACNYTAVVPFQFLDRECYRSYISWPHIELLLVIIMLVGSSLLSPSTRNLWNNTVRQKYKRRLILSFGASSNEEKDVFVQGVLSKWVYTHLSGVAWTFFKYRLILSRSLGENWPW